MSTIKISILIILIALSAGILSSCGNSDDPAPDDTTTVGSITVTDFTTSIDENPVNGFDLGTVSARTSDGATLTYSLSNQNVARALVIDANTGALSVADASAFDFETNPTITAAYTASNGTDDATANITITVNDIIENNRPFLTTWKTTTNNERIAFPLFLPLNSSTYTIDWGDGSSTTHNEVSSTSLPIHTYATAGDHIVSVSGSGYSMAFSNLTFGTGPQEIDPSFETSFLESRSKLQSVDQWGDNMWSRLDFAFSGCVNLTIGAMDTPNFSQLTTLAHMFAATTLLTGDFSNWNVSNVTRMESMFQGSGFNGDISNWDVSNVTNMQSMFRSTPNFNRDLSNWSVANVSSCSGFAVDSGLNSSNRPNFTNCNPG